MSGAARHSAAIVGVAGTRLSPAEAQLFREVQPWGFILFARNIESAAQVQCLTAELRDAVGREALITIDQEGGRVARLTPPLARAWPPALDEAQGARAHAARCFYIRARVVADELRALGLDSNCAPLGDIARPETHAILRNRCYGTAAAEVVANARAAADGFLAGGVVPVLKHMPGHGRAVLDSHLDLPRITAEAEELHDEDFAAFAALADLPAAMTAHLVFASHDPERPATTSPVMNRVMREEIGFGGLLMSDDISMNALSGTLEERSHAARTAGCDLVLHCNGVLDEARAVLEAAGPLTGKSAARAARALEARVAPDEADIPALLDERARLRLVAGAHI